MIVINGEKINISKLSLLDYISEKKYKINQIAVELNGKIVKKPDYNKIVFVSGDKVEIVCFVGGG